MGLVRTIVLNNWKEKKECYRIIHGNQWQQKVSKQCNVINGLIQI